MAGKNQFIQTMRGFSILAVILIHCVNGLALPVDSFGFNYSIILRQFIDFPVALFIFLSGYFAGMKLEVSVARQASRARLVRLLLPYGVWTAVYVSVSIVLGQPQSVEELVRKVVLGSSAGHMYFIVVLIQLTLLTPLMQRALTHPVGDFLMLAVTPLHFFVLYCFQFVLNEPMPLYAVLFSAWHIYYYVGLSVAAGKRKAILGKSWVMVALALVASLLEAYFILATAGDAVFAVSQIKVSSLLYSFAVINWMMARLESSEPVPVLARLGDVSYGIYYAHFLFIIVLTVAFSPLIQSNSVLLIPLQILQLMVAALGSWGLVISVRRVIGPKHAARWLGF